MPRFTYSIEIEDRVVATLTHVTERNPAVGKQLFAAIREFLRCQMVADRSDFGELIATDGFCAAYAVPRLSGLDAGRPTAALIIIDERNRKKSVVWIASPFEPFSLQDLQGLARKGVKDAMLPYRSSQGVE